MRYILAVLLLAAAIGAAAWHSVGKIERALTSEVEAAVAAAEAPGATVVVDGLDAILTGEVADEATKARVEEAVARVPGVRQLSSQLTLSGSARRAAPSVLSGVETSDAGDVADTEVSPGPETPTGAPTSGLSGVNLGTPIEPPANALSQSGCRTEIAALLATGKIDFASSSSDLQPASASLIDSVASILARCPEVRIEVAGHTDASGPRDDNVVLSADRAEAVRAALEARGVDASRLTAVGYGPDQPLVDNATPEGRAENRRIEFRILDQP